MNTPTKQTIKKEEVGSEIKRLTKPVSISISPILNTKKAETVKTETNIQTSEQQNESYSGVAFEKAWKDFAQTVPEIVSVVSYINNTLPEKIDDHTYELTFSNVFQEGEFKKLLSELCFSIRKTLKNSSINFVTKVVETIEKDTNSNPEEILKRMTEQNPALQLLKKNFNLELD
ncbi:MAG: hypothetical protein VB102_11195 [Paludibacter sp.]|nr:hypothetical protein [Paludibacter sp.]